MYPLVVTTALLNILRLCSGTDSSRLRLEKDDLVLYRKSEFYLFNQIQAFFLTVTFFCCLNVTTDSTQDANPGLWCQRALFQLKINKMF